MPFKIADHYLTPQQALSLLKVSEQTLADWRSEGKGPPYEKVGYFVLYPKKEFEEYASSRTRARSTSGRGAGGKS